MFSCTATNNLLSIVATECQSCLLLLWQCEEEDARNARCPKLTYLPHFVVPVVYLATSHSHPIVLITLRSRETSTRSELYEASRSFKFRARNCIFFMRAEAIVVFVWKMVLFGSERDLSWLGDTEYALLQEELKPNARIQLPNESGSNLLSKDLVV